MTEKTSAKQKIKYHGARIFDKDHARIKKLKKLLETKHGGAWPSHCVLNKALDVLEKDLRESAA
jgi:hypothetical protein